MWHQQRRSSGPARDTQPEHLAPNSLFLVSYEPQVDFLVGSFRPNPPPTITHQSHQLAGPYAIMADKEERPWAECAPRVVTIWCRAPPHAMCTRADRCCLVDHDQLEVSAKVEGLCASVALSMGQNTIVSDFFFCVVGGHFRCQMLVQMLPDLPASQMTDIPDRRILRISWSVVLVCNS